MKTMKKVFGVLILCFLYSESVYARCDLSPKTKNIALSLSYDAYGLAYQIESDYEAFEVGAYKELDDILNDVYVFAYTARSLKREIERARGRCHGPKRALYRLENNYNSLLIGLEEFDYYYVESDLWYRISRKVRRLRNLLLHGRDIGGPRFEQL